LLRVWNHVVSYICVCVQESSERAKSMLDVEQKIGAVSGHVDDMSTSFMGLAGQHDRVRHLAKMGNVAESELVAHGLTAMVCSSSVWCGGSVVVVGVFVWCLGG